MNSDLEHFSDCVFYDAELRQLRKSFKDADDILKHIVKRAERRQTVQISKSLFQFVERKNTMKVAPQEYFDFRMDEYRISIYMYKGSYHVQTLGFSYYPDTLSFEQLAGPSHLYYGAKYLKDLVPRFREIVLWFIERYVRDWDDVPHEEIPF